MAIPGIPRERDIYAVIGDQKDKYYALVFENVSKPSKRKIRLFRTLSRIEEDEHDASVQMYHLCSERKDVPVMDKRIQQILFSKGYKFGPSEAFRLGKAVGEGHKLYGQPKTYLPQVLLEPARVLARRASDSPYFFQARFYEMEWDDKVDFTRGVASVVMKANSERYRERLGGALERIPGLSNTDREGINALIAMSSFLPDVKPHQLDRNLAGTLFVDMLAAGLTFGGPMYPNDALTAVNMIASDESQRDRLLEIASEQVVPLLEKKVE